MSDIEIPNIVKVVTAEFGYEIKLYILDNVGPQELDRVLGLKQVRNTVYIRQIKVDDARRPVVNKELDVFESEIIPVHKHLLLVTDGSGVDITEKFLAFTENLCKNLEKDRKLDITQLEDLLCQRNKE